MYGIGTVAHGFKVSFKIIQKRHIELIEGERLPLLVCFEFVDGGGVSYRGPNLSRLFQTLDLSPCKFYKTFCWFFDEFFPDSVGIRGLSIRL